jgi:hypothetical protein
MLAFVILIMVNAYILMKTGESPAIQAAPGEKGWTIFGTMGCGWTRKQLEHMKKVKKPFTFVDCDQGGCDGVDAFPMTVDPEGEKHIGYKEF